jgi:hypothetical protein
MDETLLANKTEFVMKKPLLYCFITLIAASVLAQPALAADGVVAPQLSAIDLSAMPLVSRSLSEFSSEAGSPEVDPVAEEQSSTYSYRRRGEGPGWLFASLIEPFYLSMLGAVLLILGTVTGRKDV